MGRRLVHPEAGPPWPPLDSGGAPLPAPPPGLPGQGEHPHAELAFHLHQLTPGHHLAVDRQLHRLSRRPVQFEDVAHPQRHHLVRGDGHPGKLHGDLQRDVGQQVAALRLVHRVQGLSFRLRRPIGLRLGKSLFPLGRWGNGALKGRLANDDGRDTRLVLAVLEEDLRLHPGAAHAHAEHRGALLAPVRPGGQRIQQHHVLDADVGQVLAGDLRLANLRAQPGAHRGQHPPVQLEIRVHLGAPLRGGLRQLGRPHHPGGDDQTHQPGMGAQRGVQVDDHHPILLPQPVRHFLRPTGHRLQAELGQAGVQRGREGLECLEDDEAHHALLDVGQGPQAHGLAHPAQQHVHQVVGQRQLHLQHHPLLERARGEHRQEGGVSQVALKLLEGADLHGHQIHAGFGVKERLEPGIQGLGRARGRQHALHLQRQPHLSAAHPLQVLKIERLPGPGRTDLAQVHQHRPIIGSGPIIPAETHARTSKRRSSSFRPRPVRALLRPSFCSSIILSTSRSLPLKTAWIFPFLAESLMDSPLSTLLRRSIWNSACPAPLVPTRARSTIFWAISLAMARIRSEPVLGLGLATGTGAISAGLKRKPAAAAASPPPSFLSLPPPP
ncbi:hypothetical protein STIAU_4362 [Stigmatella aurantiaca DW4/3-1]|uniref:Uncharacterized protein n=1 Tax=Stigmatella aurantiaca (strain DW4/3-1) TaxID=378806 RepID=Q08UP7_STIAD|nr:hypothetical protein STIAU_4362 [Stigmatella aurantiaca DW4/3-1]